MGIKSIDGMNSKVDMIEERISEMENCSEEITQNAECRET